MAISSKVVACTRKLVVFSGYLDACACMMSCRPRKQAFAKTDQSTFGSGVVVISLMTELLIGDGYHSLPLCVYVCVDVWQIWSHIW